MERRKREERNVVDEIMFGGVWKLNNFIPLNRSITNHWLWKDKPFTKGQAWIDLIMLANHTTVKTIYKDEIVECKRGDVNFSMSYLAERWGWDRKKVSRFLKALELDNMVRVNATTHRTTITLINYGTYNEKKSSQLNN